MGRASNLKSLLNVYQGKCNPARVSGDSNQTDSKQSRAGSQELLQRWK